MGEKGRRAEEEEEEKKDEEEDKERGNRKEKEKIKEGREKAKEEEEEEVEGLICQLILKLQLDLIDQNVKVLCIFCLKNVMQMF